MFMSITWHRNNFSHYFPTKIQAERNFHHHRKRLHRETHWREQDPGGEERRLNTNTDTEISYSNKQKDDLGCSLDPAQQDLFSQLLQKQVRRRLWLQEWCLFVFLFSLSEPSSGCACHTCSLYFTRGIDLTEWPTGIHHSRPCCYNARTPGFFVMHVQGNTGGDVNMDAHWGGAGKEGRLIRARGGGITSSYRTAKTKGRQLVQKFVETWNIVRTL